MITVTLEASNRADWTIQITATDDTTGDDLDFTGASVSFVVRDFDNHCVKLTATTDNGLITINSTLIEITFPKSNYMETLCAKPYEVGCIYVLNSVTTQLLTGTVSVYDGIASL